MLNKKFNLEKINGKQEREIIFRKIQKKVIEKF